MAPQDRSPLRLTPRGWLLMLLAALLVGMATADIGLPGWSS